MRKININVNLPCSRLMELVSHITNYEQSVVAEAWIKANLAISYTEYKALMRAMLSKRVSVLNY